MCSVPSVWSRISRTARGTSRRVSRRDQPAVLRVAAAEHLLGVGDPGQQVAHVALGLGHGGDQPRRARGLRDADVEARVQPAVLGEVLGRRHPLDRVVQPLDVVGLCAFAGQDDGARSRRPRAPRAPPTPPRRAAAVPPCATSGGPQRRRRAAAAPAVGHEMAALHERGQCLAQGGARDPQLVGQVTLGRELRPREGAGPAGWPCPAARRSPRMWSGADTGSNTAAVAALRSISEEGTVPPPKGDCTK